MNAPAAPALVLRAASLSPRSLDREARTVEAVASTGADVERLGFTERLPVAAADLRGLEGAPVLDSHRRMSVRDVLGVVEASRIEGGNLIVRIKFSRRAEVDPILDDIEDGALRGISLGYQVNAWKDERTAAGRVIRTATRWTPKEVSIVSVPADEGATIRSSAMPENQITQDRPATPAAPNPAPVTRAQVNAEIRSIGRLAGLEAGWADGQIDAEATVEAARAAAFDAMATRSAAPIRTQRATILHDNDAPELRGERMGEALYARMNPSHQLSEPARAFYGMTTVDMARDMLQRAGVSTTGLAPAALVTRALHTTSDFSIILGDTVGRTLRAAYSAAPAGVKMAGAQTTARDFRARQRIMLGEAPSLEKVNEAGEFTSGTMAEAAESYKVETYGRIIGISRQAIINDDLGAFANLAARFGQAAAQFEAQFLVDLLLANPAMSDGKALFHADHGNLAGSGAAPDDTTLAAARTAMRRQTGVSGERIAVTPKHFIVPPELEETALKLVAAITPAKTDDVNTHTNLSVIVEPRFTSATAWYLVASPSEIDGLEFAYLEGAPGPQIESRNGFEVDGVQIKVRLDFGAGFVDWRGWYRNAGA
ncbi:prohead protease/major capsid protein fusion protein [Albimonas pacifica]|uniref:Prohead serine protease n=1 Tax=Albimonas pacifica TaxID=1114924 RepID=A0A1I3FAJ3_9RHOB|nr:prohead protease/major capsid protein fusion protein [Albimonas pacifica]SFI08225.1 prohead serine protease [Albimonas pacifica]